MSEQPDPEAAVVEIEYPTTEELVDVENVSSISQVRGLRGTTNGSLIP